jgi:hypothetical protein
MIKAKRLSLDRLAFLYGSLQKKHRGNRFGMLPLWKTVK